MLLPDPHPVGAIFFDIPPGVLLTVALPFAAAALLAVTLFMRRKQVRGQKRPRAAMRRVEDRELCSLVSRLESDNRQYQRLVNVLPDFTRQLGRDLDRRSMAPLLVDFLDHLFGPQRVMLFLQGSSSGGLVAVSSKGLKKPVSRETVIRPGDGRIGWVALHRVSMTGEEFAARGVRPSDIDPALRELEREIALCVPMVHEGQLRGVIAFAELPRMAFDPKPVARMIADLGTITLEHSVLLRQAELAANQDDLTGLYNRRYMQTALDAELARSQASGEPLSVFFFDVDHFKSYNDVNGHQAGDEALAAIGRLTSEALRDGDVPARYGGEEFVAILPGTGTAGAADAASKIRRAILDHDFQFGGRQPGGRVTISGGLASWPADGLTAAELLRAADAALYRAKRSGRDRIEAARTGAERSRSLGAAEA